MIVRSVRVTTLGVQHFKTVRYLICPETVEQKALYSTCVNYAHSNDLLLVPF